MNEDAISDWQANLDQSMAAVRDTAPIVATMFRELRNQGLSFDESISLAAAWVTAAGRE